MSIGRPPAFGLPYSSSSKYRAKISWISDICCNSNCPRQRTSLRLSNVIGSTHTIKLLVVRPLIVEGITGKTMGRKCSFGTAEVMGRTVTLLRWLKAVPEIIRRSSLADFCTDWGIEIHEPDASQSVIAACCHASSSSVNRSLSSSSNKQASTIACCSCCLRHACNKSSISRLRFSTRSSM